MKVVPLPTPDVAVGETGRGRRRIDLFPYLLVAPIALLLTAISFYPALYAVWLAMTDANLLRLARAQFIGFDNFLRLIDDPIFLQGLWRTLRWDLAVVFIELAIALPIALFLNLNFRGRGIVRAAVVVPYIIPPAVTALMWVYMFDGNFGVGERPSGAARPDRSLRLLAQRSNRRVLGHRRRDGLGRSAADGHHHPCGAADHSRGALRGGEGRRRQCVAALPVRHAAAAHADRSCSSCCCA